MKSRSRSQFDMDLFCQLAGDKAFARGQSYACHGQIVLLSMNEAGVLAAAFGTADYLVWLNRAGGKMPGRCSCPAFEDSSCCKHMVATAMVANEAEQTGEHSRDLVGEMAGRIAKLDKARLETLVLEMAMGDWRVLRSLCLALELEWEFDFD